MTEPTDAEIIALNAGEIHFSESPTKYPEAGHGTQYHAGAPGVLSFARAVLARWGQPAHSVEPVAWLDPWTGTKVTTDYDAYGKHGIPLYTAPQPVVREPLPSIASVAMIDATMVEMRKIYPPLRRSECRQLIDAALSAAHGIKIGGQHGTE